MSQEQFLSDAETWLFRELELLHQIHAEIRDTHLKYQSWFIVGQSVLLAAVMNMVTTGAARSHPSAYFTVCLVGFGLGVSSLLLQFPICGMAMSG